MPAPSTAGASRALAGGLDTPRVHAILAFAHRSTGDDPTAARHLFRHFELVTTDLRHAPPLGPGATQSVELVPGRAWELPLPATAGEQIVVVTGGRAITDSIAVLVAPDGTPVSGGDDEIGAFAAIDWQTLETGTYRLRVTSFEAVQTGMIEVTRS
jgi:hypothetical protein